MENVPASMQARGQNHCTKEQRRAPPVVSGIVEPVTFTTQVFAVEMVLVVLVGVKAEI